MPTRPPARVRRWQATIIITLFFMAVVGAAAVGWWYARESPPHQGPILLISVDGLAAGAIHTAAAGGASGSALDALAADAVVFDHAYSHSPQVLPAHASILSGQLPVDHGVRDDAGFVLKPDVRTLAELLRGRGFNTGAVMSSVFLRRDSGLAQGFAFYDTEATDRDESAGREHVPVSPIDAAERWARSQGGQRYFLLLQVDAADAEPSVARLTQLLKERRLYDDSTVILVGDRGRASVAASLDEPTLHVPLLIKLPNRESAGRRITTPVQQIDLLPTILDFVRAPIPGGLRGRSLRKAIDGDTPLPSQPIYSESLAGYYRFGAAPMFAMTTDRYRYVRSGDEQVSPLDGGPAPADNEIGAVRRALDRLIASRPIVPPAPIGAADQERLARAGYLPGLPPPMPTPTPASRGLEASGNVAAAAAPRDDTVIDGTEEEKLADAHHAAAVLAGERMFGAAVRALQAMAREHPGVASVHYQIGMLLARSGRFDEAVAPLLTAGDLRPDAVDVPLALADVLTRAGRLDEAQEQAERAIAIAEPLGGATLGEAHAVAARVALARKDTAAATMQADAALAADPGMPMPQFVQGRLAYEDGRYDAALTAFREAVAVTREHGTSVPELHRYLGEALAHMEQYSEAETEFREELETFPRDFQAYGSLAMLYHAAGRDGDVEDVLNDLVEAAPTPEGYALAARMWTILGERSRAEALRSDARARFRGDPSLALLGRDGRR
jgi:tetratricopeptide (TPR) repeat protein